MNTYKRHRFPPDIISYAVWLYYRFNLSHCNIEDMLAERGITVTLGGLENYPMGWSRGYSHKVLMITVRWQALRQKIMNSLEKFGLEGKVALITGARRGLRYTMDRFDFLVMECCDG